MADTTNCANSVFEQPWWLELVAPGEWGEVFVKNNGEIIARLPYVLRKGRIVMPEYTQTLGPWMSPELRAFRTGNSQLSRQKEVIGELISKLPEHKSFNMIFDSANDYILPYRWLDFRYVPTFSYRISELGNLDEVFARFHKTARKNIRRAEGRLTVKRETDPASVTALFEKTFQHQKRSTPGGSEFITKLMQEAIDRGQGCIFTAYDEEGNAHAGDFLLYDENVCYDLIGGSDPEFRNSGAASLIFREAIRFASENSKAFDFEGSNIEGIENIFRQFGGERVINYNVIKQSLFADCMDMAKPRIKKLIGYKY